MGTIGPATAKRQKSAVPVWAAYVAGAALVGFFIGRATSPHEYVNLPVDPDPTLASRRTVPSPAKPRTAESAQDAVNRLLLKAPAASAPESLPRPTPRSAASIFQVATFETRTTESNTSWSRVGWRLVIKNLDDRPHLFDATVEFQDSAGFVVDEDNEYSLRVPALGEETFTGYDLVGSNIRDQIARTEVKVRLRE